MIADPSSRDLRSKLETGGGEDVEPPTETTAR